MKASILALAALAISVSVQAAIYSRSESLSGQGFLDFFEWQTISDPTHGRVNYVSRAVAQSDGLYSISGSTVTLRADDTTVLSSSGPGRNSFRLMSNNQYSSHVAIFDIGHMPTGCGTWPAVWLVSFCPNAFTQPCTPVLVCTQVGANWPDNGEIDIVEGVNSEPPNQSTLHTSSGCTMPSSRAMTGSSVSTDCEGSSGCGVKMSDSNSFGSNFNDIGGGWYAMERSSTHISVYFWERGSSSVPPGVANPGSTIDTSIWGMPTAYFPNTNCNFGSHFGPMNIIINLTFCGDWAGAVYSSDGCPSTCSDYVDNNPSEFSDAYFAFNALNIYE